MRDRTNSQWLNRLDPNRNLMAQLGWSEGDPSSTYAQAQNDADSKLKEL